MSFLSPLGDGQHFRTTDGSLVLRDDTVHNSVELHERIWTVPALQAMRLDRCGEIYGKGWLSLYLALDDHEQVGPVRRRRVEALIVESGHRSRAVPHLVRLRLSAAVRRDQPLEWHLATTGFQPLAPRTATGRWYRLDPKSDSSVLCHVDAERAATFYHHVNMLGWPPSSDGRNRFFPPCRLSDLTAYHERIEGESTPEVTAELMPFTHFHTADGRIVCAPSGAKGLIEYPEEMTDFGYGYFD
jgi:hypothetical protein